jgi:AcrR family transcriptional regulator
MPEKSMDEQSEGAGTDQTQTSRRQERANRILDAASALILRWGYDKTTIDDIAKQAGVAKGTIYLHWKTREDLFESLMRRETVLLEDDLKQRIAADPAGSTLCGIYKHSALALVQRPLLKAFILRDMDVIGKLALGEQSTVAYAERMAGFQTYLEFLRERGLIRTDLSLRAEVYVVSAVFYGFFLVAPLAPPDIAPSDEELAELIGETIRRTLESGRPVSTGELQTVAGAFLPYFDSIMKNDRKHVYSEEQPQPETGHEAAVDRRITGEE